MNNFAELSKNTVVFALGNISIKLIQFFILPLITISLSLADYNTVELLNSGAELLLPILALGLAEAVFRFSIGNKHNKKSVLSNAMVIVVGGSVLMLLVICIINFVYPQNYWFLFCGLYASYSISSVLSYYARGIEKIKTFAISGVLQALLLVLLVYVLVFHFKLGIVGYLWASIAANCFKIIILAIFGKVLGALRFKYLDNALLRKMLIYALPLIPNGLLWWILEVANRYICTLYLGGDISGLYTVASKIPALINVFSTVFLQAWTISTAKTIDSSDVGYFNTQVFRYFSAFMMCMSSAMFVVLPYVSKLILQGEFYSAWPMSGIMVFSAVLSCYASFFGVYYNAAMKNKMILVSSIAGVVIDLALAFGLIKVLGVNALLIAGLCSYFVVTVIRMINTRKISKIKINYLKTGLIFLIVLSQAVLISFVGKNWWWYHLIAFALLILININDNIRLTKKIFQAIKAFGTSKKLLLETNNNQISDGVIIKTEDIPLIENDAESINKQEQSDSDNNIKD